MNFLWFSLILQTIFLTTFALPSTLACIEGTARSWAWTRKVEHSEPLFFYHYTDTFLRENLSRQPVEKSWKLQYNGVSTTRITRTDAGFGQEHCLNEMGELLYWNLKYLILKKYISSGKLWWCYESSNVCGFFLGGIVQELLKLTYPLQGTLEDDFPCPFRWDILVL